jgi:hypothetical protein
LAEQLRAWARRYEDNTELGEWSDQSDRAAWDSWGRDLVESVYGELGPEYDVEYFEYP